MKTTLAKPAATLGGNDVYYTFDVINGGRWNFRSQIKNFSLAAFKSEINSTTIRKFLDKIDRQAKEAAALNPPIEEEKEKIIKVAKIPRVRIERNIVFPKGNFTVKSVAEQNKVEPQIIAAEIVRLRKLGEIFEVVGKVEKIGKGRKGKKQNILKLVTGKKK